MRIALRLYFTLIQISNYLAGCVSIWFQGRTCQSRSSDRRDNLVYLNAVEPPLTDTPITDTAYVPTTYKCVQIDLYIKGTSLSQVKDTYAGPLNRGSTVCLHAQLHV